MSTYKLLFGLSKNRYKKNLISQVFTLIINNEMLLSSQHVKCYSLTCSCRFLYNRSGEWSDGTVPILATTAAGFTYIAFLMVSPASNIYCGEVKHVVFIIMP